MLGVYKITGKKKKYTSISPTTIKKNATCIPKPLPQIDACPLGSYGKNNASNPPQMVTAPAIYTGTAVVKLAYSAMIEPLSNSPYHQV